MAVSFKVIDNRSNISRKIKELQDQLGNYKTYFLQGMANSLIANSPVDTGNYVTSFRVGNSRATGFTDSIGKPKNQDYNTQYQLGLDRLSADITALADNDLNNVVFTNVAVYAYDVEYTYGDAPFTITRNLASNISKDAAARAKAT
tara:strand:- start:4514 stop:4951 length:438 start_codon:yes stop_codon:yes gene_type:complete